MGMREMGWALKLTGVSPLAKLVAIYIGDYTWVGGEGTGAPILLPKLREFACSDERGVRAAIAELTENVDVCAEEIAPGQFYFTLPLEREMPTSPRGPDTSPLFLYVMSCGARTKVGIAGDAEARRLNLQSYSAEIVKLEWAVRGPAHAIRRAERGTLQVLASDRIHSEWFSCEPSDAIAVAIKQLQLAVITATR